MGGKTSQSTQQVTIPPDVLARYNSVNANAQQVSQTPFQQYGGEFVSPVNQQQQAGIAATNQAAGMAQPYYGAATQQLMGAQGAGQNYYGAATAATQGAYQGAQPYNQAATNLALMGAGPVNAQQIGGQQIGHFMSPYLGSVVGSEAALLNQNNQQAMSGQLGSAIQSGAFGGDRGGVAAANLAQQQQLANANIYSGLLNQGYGQALSAAQQQQGVNLSAEQANRAALQQASGQLAGIGQQGYAQGTGTGAQLASLGQGVYGMGAGTSQALAGLGAGAQEAALQGAQAQLGAGTLQQQTQQAQDTALYNQFLQQQSYPFQTAQFMANIAEGTGALSGSTTTATQPGALLARGGTADRRHTRYAGGLVPSSEGGAVGYEHAGEGFAGGGMPMLPGLGAGDYAAILQAQQQMYAPFGGAGLYGGPASGSPHGGLSYVPQANLPVLRLTTAGALTPNPSALDQMHKFADIGNDVNSWLPKKKSDPSPSKSSPSPSGSSPSPSGSSPSPSGSGPSSSGSGSSSSGSDSSSSGSGSSSSGSDSSSVPPGSAPPGLFPAANGSNEAARGGVAGGRHLFADGGMPYSDQGGPAGLDIPDQTPQTHQLATAGALSNPQSGLGQLGDAAGAIGSMAKLGGSLAGLGGAAGAAGAAGGIGGTIASALPFLAMFNTGGSVTGRQHRATGGLAGRRGYATPGRVGDGSTATDDNVPPEQSIVGKTLGWLGKTIPNVMENLGRANQVSSAAQHNAVAATWGGDLWPTPFFDDETPPPANNQSASGVAPAPSHPWATKGSSATSNPPWATKGSSDTSNPPPEPNAVPPPPAGLSSQAQAIHDKVDHYNNGVAAATYNAKKAIKDEDSKTGWSEGPFGGLEQDQGIPGSVKISQPSLSQPSLGGEPNIPATTGRAPLQLSTGVSFPQYTPTPTPPSGLGAMAQGVGKDFNTVAGGLGQFASHLGSGIGDYLGEAAKGNPQYLVPLLTGLAAMTAAPTRNFGVALAQGLGTGAETYPALQTQQANIARTQAQTAAEQAETYYLQQKNAPPNMQAVPGPGPDGKAFPGSDGKPWHYELKVGYANFGQPGGASTPGATPAAAPATKRAPISTDYASGATNIGPSSDTDAYMASNYHIDPNAPGVANAARIYAMNPELEAQNAAAQQRAQARVGNLADVDATHRQYVQLGVAINSLSPGAFGPGASFEDRIQLANIYTTAMQMMGVPPDPSVSANLDAAQIISKINALQGPQLASQYGERAASIAHGLTAVMPGGHFQLNAANDVLGTLMVQNQQARDFPTYYNNYVAKYGTSIGAEQAFQRDMGPVYDAEQKEIPKAFKRTPTGSSLAEIIQKNPAAIEKVEKGGKRPEGSVVNGLGDGFSRYFR